MDRTDAITEEGLWWIPLLPGLIWLPIGAALWWSAAGWTVAWPAVMLAFAVFGLGLSADVAAGVGLLLGLVGLLPTCLALGWELLERQWWSACGYLSRWDGRRRCSVVGWLV